MSSHKYELLILKYKDNITEYVLRSYEHGEYVDKLNINNIVETNNKYELKIKLNLLGLYFINMVSPNIEVWNRGDTPEKINCKIFDLCQTTKYMN